MNIKTTDLIEDLRKRTETIIQKLNRYKKLSQEVLAWREDPARWNILENIEHLNLYGDYYLPEMERAIKSTKHTSPSSIFKSSWLGNYFAKAMIPTGKNKMNTFKSKNPLNANIGPEVLDIFLQQQQRTLDILAKSERINMTKTKTSTTIGKYVRIRLGDTLRVVIYHNERHITQIEGLLEKQGVTP